ncbi:MAG: diguanylate cyclase [Fimbriimonadaceae bacterium]|nr:diguanylate cyclase [Fimbriimonadaceae bacterium]QYK54885.1 MAG: diguanylate cyclase [Fimbriimonadaceae bacterium]
MKQGSRRSGIASLADRSFVSDVLRFGVVGALMLGALIGFIVLLPTVPLHTKTVAVHVLIGLGTCVVLSAFYFARSRLPIGGALEPRGFSTALLAVGALAGATVEAVGAFVPSFEEHALNGRLFCHLLIALGVVFVPRRLDSGLAQFRAILEALLVSASVVVVGWYFLIGPVWLNPPFTGVDLSQLLRLLACDLVLTSVVLVYIQRGAIDAHRAPMWVLAQVAFFLFGTDLAYFYFVTGGKVPPVSLLDAGSGVGYVLTGMAAFAVRFGPSRNADAPFRLPSLWQASLPFLSLPVVLGILVRSVGSGDDVRLSTGVVIGAVTCFALVLIRQVASLHESRTLYGNLVRAFDRLEDQTNEIEAQNEELRELNDQLDQTTKRLAEANVLLQRMATTDPLTGLANRRSLQLEFRQAVDECRRLRVPIAVAMIDVDHFKKYNDAHGHAAGDEALRLVADAIREAVRAADIPARYGGEEFSVVLPGADEADAATVSERIRIAVRDLDPPLQKITASIGYAVITSEWDMDPSKLFVLADEALYRAKREGRDRVVSWNEPERKGAKVEPAPPPTLIPVSSGIRQEIAIAIEAAVSLDENRSVRDRDRRSLEALLATLELRDTETVGHGERVMWTTLLLATVMHDTGLFALDVNWARKLAFGALLHDIGKIGVTDVILRKPSSLDEVETGLMRRHPMLGVRLVERFDNLADALDIVRSHHERWDGRGYPDGLSKEDIPLAARIFAVCDAYDAMASVRAYQGAQPYDRICEELRDSSAIQFDPEVVECFLRIPKTDLDLIAEGSVQWVLDAVWRRVSPDAAISA